MVNIMFTVFELDGEKYVADQSVMLTSTPPKYNSYRIKDKAHIYVFCSDVKGDEYMTPTDFYEWLHGKPEQSTMQGGTGFTGVYIGDNNVGHGGNIIAQASVKRHPVDPVIHKREPTDVEKLSALVQRLEKDMADILTLLGDNE